LVYSRIQQGIFYARAQEDIVYFESRVETYRYAHRQRQISLGYAPLAEDDPFFLLNIIADGLRVMNHRLYLESQPNLLDPFNYSHPCFSLEPWGLDLDILGVISIPAIDLHEPIYMGTSIQNLNRGAAHLTHSSFPVGGANTNAVIAGRRNGNYTSVFEDICQLVIGDEIIITNIAETITYVVAYVQVLEHEDMCVLAIRYGEDLVTLVAPQNYRLRERRLVVVAERL